MILTGRAKDDFLSWYGTGEHYFTVTLNPIEQYANIVEWLDGLSIRINVGSYQSNKDGCAVYEFYIDINPKEQMCPSKFQSRQQATEAAIKLANQIYNENTI